MNGIIEFDKAISVAINNWGTPFWDPIMKFVSEIYVWAPLYILVIIAIFLKFRPKISMAFITIAAIIITIVLTDQISVLIKDLVCRFRPCHDPSLEGMLRIIVAKGGKYGFVSSHAANVFGFALLTSMIFRKRWYTILIFVWATLISFSRIYLAKHFLGDVLCGALLGVSIALLMKLLLTYIERKAISRQLAD